MLYKKFLRRLRIKKVCEPKNITGKNHCMNKFFSFLLVSLMVTSSSLLSEKASAQSAKGQRYKVAVIDLMILKRQKLGAFQLAKEIGADGVEVDMGGLGKRPTFDNKLLTDSIRTQFLNKAKEL